MWRLGDECVASPCPEYVCSCSKPQLLSLYPVILSLDLQRHDVAPSDLLCTSAEASSNKHYIFNARGPIPWRETIMSLTSNLNLTSTTPSLHFNMWLISFNPLLLPQLCTSPFLRMSNPGHDQSGTDVLFMIHTFDLASALCWMPFLTQLFHIFTQTSDLNMKALWHSEWKKKKMWPLFLYLCQWRMWRRARLWMWELQRQYTFRNNLWTFLSDSFKGLKFF